MDQGQEKSEATAPSIKSFERTGDLTYELCFCSSAASRDSYIHVNNGGLANLPHRFNLNLRSNTHNPNQVILLPSYGPGVPSTARSSHHTSLAATATQAAARANPKARALRQHQRLVSNYLHTAGSRFHKPAPPPSQAYGPIPSLPQTTLPPGSFTRSGYGFGTSTARLNELRGSGSQTARSSGVGRNPYQRSLTSKWSDKKSDAGYPVSQPYVESFQDTNFTETFPIGQSYRFPQPLPQPQQPEPTVQPQQPQYQSTKVNESVSPSRSLNSTGESKKWSETASSLPSYRYTLPKNSSYLDCANTHVPLPNYNLLSPAGYSDLDRQRALGCDEHAVPLLC